MKNNPSDPRNIIELFFAIEPGVIAQDSWRAENNIKVIEEEIHAVAGVSFDAMTAELAVRNAHLVMIRAHEICRQNRLAPEVQCFYTRFGIGGLTDAAESMASDRDAVLALFARMGTICHQEDINESNLSQLFRDDLHDVRDENELDGDLLYCVDDMVFVFALRRYHMNYHAELFERDRQQFDISCEIGRRVTKTSDAGDSRIAEIMDDLAKKSFGEPAFTLIARRVHELRGRQ